MTSGSSLTCFEGHTLLGDFKVSIAGHGGGGGGGGLSGCSNPMRILIFLAIVVYLLYGNSLRRGL